MLSQLILSTCRSTMPVTSTVQTPEMFKGTLKEYQMKGLQWLVNCYEQVLSQLHLHLLFFVDFTEEWVYTKIIFLICSRV